MANPLQDALRHDPNSFEFFQAMRLLRRLQPQRGPVGEFAAPSEECVRITSNPSLSFPASEIQGIDWAEGKQPQLNVNIMGLTGPVGVLPYTYSQLSMERSQARDHAFRDFLDLFHHRMASLFYRAWEKYRGGVGYEVDDRNRFTHYLRDFIGLGSQGHENRQDVPDEALVFYAGLLLLQTRPASALQQILEDYFQVPVEVEQFAGGWYPVPRDAQCCLDDEELPRRQLGGGALAGDEVWEHQIRARIAPGPLTLEQFRQFLPGAPAHRALVALCKFFSNGQTDFAVQLILRREEVPPMVLDDQDRLPLGLCSWLRVDEPAADPRDAQWLI